MSFDPAAPDHSLSGMTNRWHPMLDDARRAPALWRLILGIATVFAVMSLWIFGLFALRSLLPIGGNCMSGTQGYGFNAQTPLDAALYLLFVAGLGIGTLCASWIWQRRSPRSLIGRGARTFRHAAIAGSIAFGVLGLISLLALPFTEAPARNLNLSTWLIWLPVGLAALILQTGGEEVFFRGYLQSQLAARFGSTTVAAVAPSILFGFAHYVPFIPPEAALIYVAIAALFGILAADLTIRTGSLGAAWGFHLANNTLAVLFIAPSGTVTGLALWRTGYDLTAYLEISPAIAFEVLVILGSWLLIRRALHV